MNKSQTLIKSGQGKKFDKLGEGDLVFTFQVNRVERGNDEYQLETNLDWSFDDPTTPIEIKCALGSFLSTVEEIFGEKMVTEAIMHYADEKGHLVKTPQGAGLHFRSKGLQFEQVKKQKV